MALEPWWTEGQKLPQLETCGKYTLLELDCMHKLYRASMVQICGKVVLGEAIVYSLLFYLLVIRILIVTN